MNLSIKQKVTDREKTYGYQSVRGNKLGNGDRPQYSVMVYVGNESKKEWV